MMMKEICIQLLKERGVEIQDIVECVVFLQEGFHVKVNREEILENIMGILGKREVQHTVMTGIGIDKAVEDNCFRNKEIHDIIKTDAGLYGLDEVLAYSICNLYGSIALTNFGYIDRVKPGIIGELNEVKEGVCNTYLDDVVGAIAAAAASKHAHKGE